MLALLPMNTGMSDNSKPSHSRGKVSWSGNNWVRRSMPDSAINVHANSSPDPACQPRPNFQRIAAEHTPVSNSTRGYWTEIGALQCLQRPRNASQLSNGMFSSTPSLCSHLGQCEGSQIKPGGAG